MSLVLLQSLFYLHAYVIHMFIDPWLYKIIFGINKCKLNESMQYNLLLDQIIQFKVINYFKYYI